MSQRNIKETMIKLNNNAGYQSKLSNQIDHDQLHLDLQPQSTSSTPCHHTTLHYIRLETLF